MTEWERFQRAVRAVVSVPAEAAEAIRRGEVSAPAKAGAVKPAEDQDRAASAREVDRKSSASPQPD